MQFYASCHISRIFCRNHTTVSKWLKGSELCKLRLITKWSYVVFHKTFKRQECCQVILKDIWNSSKSFRVTVNRQLSVMLILYLGTAWWKSSPIKSHCFIFASLFLKKKRACSLQSKYNCCVTALMWSIKWSNPSTQLKDNLMFQ